MSSAHLRYGADGWDPGRQPENGVTRTIPSPREWLWIRAEDGDLWTEARR